MNSGRKTVGPRRAPEPAGNRLLASLPPEEYQRLLPHLEHASFALGEVIYESGGRQSHIYFPTTAIISLLYLMENGSSAEMGVAGCEGLVGVALFMGGETAPNRAVVQSAGDARRGERLPHQAGHSEVGPHDQALAGRGAPLRLSIVIIYKPRRRSRAPHEYPSNL